MKEKYITGVKAKDAMIKDVIIIEKTTPVEELKEIMLFKNKEEVLVHNKGRLVGIITKNDLAKNLAKGVKPDQEVSTLMTPNVFSVSPEADLYEVRKKLREKGINRAPVVDEKGNVLGMLTVKSVCDCFSTRLEDAVKYLQTVFDSLSEAVLIVNNEGEIKYWNETANKMLTEKIFFNYSLKSYLPGKISSEILNTKQLYNEIYYDEKVSRYYSISAYPLESLPDFKGIIINLKDVTNIFELKSKLDTASGRLMFFEEQFKKLTKEFSSFGDLIYKSKVMEDIVELSLKVAKTDATVLITGESGTGKEILANAIHQNSMRADKPFIKINCSTIPQNLGESELFGFEKGSFTGAIDKKKGIFEVANGGTIFLDEITEMPLEMQAKLLRVLQEKSFFRIGSVQPQMTDVRVIAATNRNLEEMIKKGLFREDLFYRLNVISIHLPPLRERKEDIPFLINHFLKHFQKLYEREKFSIEPEVLGFLEKYDYPGNIRELKNIVERLAILADKGKITISLLPDYLLKEKSDISDDIFVENTDEEKEMLLEVLKRVKYNKTKAAKALNISRGTLYNRLRKYNLL